MVSHPEPCRGSLEVKIRKLVFTSEKPTEYSKKSPGVFLNVSSADEKHYKMVAYHGRGTYIYSLSGPGGIVDRKPINYFKLINKRYFNKQMYLW